MPHSYTSSFPEGIEVDPGIKSFFEAFYQISDTEAKHQEYVDQFTDVATVIVGSRKAVGRDEILPLRKSMWDHISKRLHTTHKIFPFGAGADEFMLYGSVDYDLKDGKKSGVDWAARGVFARDGGKWKLKYYRVYLDPTTVLNAR